MDQRLRPEERIRKQSDFSFLYKQGSRYRGRYFTVVYLPNNLSYSRLGVVVSKKVGGAVERNKVKRRLRALFRRNKVAMKETQDLLIIARPDVKGLAAKDLRSYYLEAVTSLDQAKKK